MRLGVVLFNLGGPDRPESVKPFLFNLFNDPAIIGAPTPIRYMLAKWISARREAKAKAIYHQLGGASPIVPNTQAQLEALKTRLGNDTIIAMAMRYWHPRAEMAASMMREANVDRIVLLPLYPQFSTATTQSSLDEWERVAPDLKDRTQAICCYPTDAGFVQAVSELTQRTLSLADPRHRPLILFSAHGLPKKIVDRGDPYVMQVEASVQAVVARLGLMPDDWRICYQSRVGPLEWVGPATEDCIRAAGRDKRSVIVVPVAFVSDHSETLVELDIEYRDLARESGVVDYHRVPVVATHPAFIDGLAAMVLRQADSTDRAACGLGEKFCPAAAKCCYLNPKN